MNFSKVDWIDLNNNCHNTKILGYDNVKVTVVYNASDVMKHSIQLFNIDFDSIAKKSNN